VRRELNFSTPPVLVSDRVHKSGHHRNDIAPGDAWEGHWVRWLAGACAASPSRAHGQAGDVGGRFSWPDPRRVGSVRGATRGGRSLRAFLVRRPRLGAGWPPAYITRRVRATSLSAITISWWSICICPPLANPYRLLHLGHKVSALTATHTAAAVTCIGELYAALPTPLEATCGPQSRSRVLIQSITSDSFQARAPAVILIGRGKRPCAISL
jgi:hypothetical protein